MIRESKVNALIQETLLIILVILGIISGCTSKNSHPSKLLDDLNNSLPPCWRNICPGVTNIDIASEQLRSELELSTYEVVVDTLDPCILWEIEKKFEEKVGIHRGVAYYQDDVVTKLVLTISGQLTFADVVARFGEPDFVVARTNYQDDLYLYVAFSYSELGLTFWGGKQSWEFKINTVKVEPQWPIVDVYIFTPEMYDLIGGTDSKSAESAQPWQGWNKEILITDHF